MDVQVDRLTGYTVDQKLINKNKWTRSNNLLPVVLISLLLLLSLPGCVSADETSPQTDQTPREIIAVVPSNFPPQYALDESGKPIGFAIDVMDQVADLAGLRVTYIVKDTWPEVFESVQDGSADLIPNLGITEERGLDYLFTEPMETTTISIFVREGFTNIDGEADLAGRKTAVFQGSQAQVLLEGRDDIELVEFLEPVDALYALLAGQVDAFVFPKNILWELAQAEGVAQQIKTVGEPLAEIKRAIAVRSDEPELYARLNSAVGEFVGSDEYQQIYRQWYGEPIPFWTTEKILPILGGFSLAITIAVILILMRGQRISSRRRVISLIAIMATIVLSMITATLIVSYQMELGEQRNHLADFAQNEARLIEAMARFYAGQHPDESPEQIFNAVFSQLKEADEQFNGFGKTGEFTLAKLEGDEIIFLVDLRYDGADIPKPIPFDGNAAEPMRRALSVESGTLIGPDYRGEMVIAAYEIAELDEFNLGIVAKIDIAEVRAPFVQAGILIGSGGLIFVALGTVLFWRISDPLIKELEERHDRLEELVEERTKELRRTKEEVETILNNAPDAILLLKSDGCIRAGNPAIQTLFGIDVAELIGQSPRQLVSAENIEELTRALHMMLTKKTVENLEVLAQHQDKTTFDADIIFAPVMEDGVFQGSVCTIRDISIMKEAERLKDEFVSNVSHELRTPITSMKLYHHILRKNPAKLVKYLPALEREAQRLEHIIEDLLYLSRLVQTKEKVEQIPIDLDILAGNYVSDRLLLAEEKDLTLSYESKQGLPLVQADEGLLNQVLGALLTNALNYTPADGQVIVSMQTERVGNQQWVGFSIKDTGKGILPEEQAQLFTRFFRGSVGHESEAAGTGLGLAIAKEILDRYQGRIEVESVLGQGTIFKVWLPVERELQVQV